MKYKRIDKMAQITGFGKSTIRRYIKLYKLPHYRLGGRCLEDAPSLRNDEIELLREAVRAGCCPP